MQISSSVPCARIFPLFKIIILSQRASISCIKCVDKIIVLSFFKFKIKFLISFIWIGSKPETGSSKSKISGLFDNATAKQAIKRMKDADVDAVVIINCNFGNEEAAADIVKQAMIDIDQALKKENSNAKLLLQVHDELIAECPENQAEEVANLIKTTMESVISLSVPLKVSVETGKRWGEFHW